MPLFLWSLDRQHYRIIIKIGYIYTINVRDVHMYIDTDTIFSMTQANQNFSAVARAADDRGEAVVFRNNKPKFLVVDLENNRYLLDLSDDEKFDIVTKRILNKYIAAFRELAK